MLIVQINIDVLVVTVFDHVPGEKVSLLLFKFEWMLLEDLFRLPHSYILVFPLKLSFSHLTKFRFSKDKICRIFWVCLWLFFMIKEFSNLLKRKSKTKKSISEMFTQMLNFHRLHSSFLLSLLAMPVICGLLNSNQFLFLSFIGNLSVHISAAPYEICSSSFLRKFWRSSDPFRSSNLIRHKGGIHFL